MITLSEKLLLVTKQEEVGNGFVEFVSSTPMTITPKYTNSGITLQYSLDTITWIDIAAKGVTSSANIIYFRGSATGIKSLFTSSSTVNAWLFTGASNLEVHGDITMLIQNTLGGKVSKIPLGVNAFGMMFYNCTSLVTAPALPSTILAQNCYSSMFYLCTNLTNAPELPATTLATGCYSAMFNNCTSLTSAPELPATTLADFCYQNMFSGCAGLTNAPELPATTLASNCYARMFTNCNNLITLPNLPATTLASACYMDMLSECTGLITVPTLPATTLATDCYKNMLVNCISLVRAPNLPATTLATGCYQGMFYNCNNLITLPNLPATRLQSNCYRTMFRGCTNIKLSTTKTGNYQTEYRVPTVGSGVTATSALTDMFAVTGGTFVGTPTINKTYYTENEII